MKKKLKIGWKHLATAETLNAQIWTTNCLQAAEIEFRFKKKNIRKSANLYHIPHAHFSTFEVKAKDYDKAVEAMKNLPEKNRTVLLKTDADYAAILTD
ncbi:MAG TPA: hypothetical protein DDY98_01255 [Ruminococcaceae bacterium]|nr:hypothetical protein [Oscillospiraceae bacterium]